MKSGNNKIIQFAKITRHVLTVLLLAGVVVSCGGGGGSTIPSTQTDPSSLAVTIGPAGGTAATMNNAVEIRVPPNVLSADTTFTASPTTNQVSTEQILGNAFDFGPEGATFSQPITVQFAVSLTDLPEEWSLSPYVLSYWSQGAWVEVPSQASSDNRTVAAEVGHFSTWAVTKRTAEPPITSPDHIWILSGSGCLSATGQSDTQYNQRLGILGQSLFGLTAPPTQGNGCVTNPYLADGYSYWVRSIENHAGIDFRAPKGTPVFAPFDGEVVWSQLDPKAGKSTLTIKSTVRGNDYLLMYVHCQSHILKRQGQTLWQLSYADPDPVKRQVLQGDQICESGSVGAGAAHLHFEVRSAGNDAGNLLSMSGSRGICARDNLAFQGYNSISGQYDVPTSPGCPLIAIRGQNVDPTVLYSLTPAAPAGIIATAGDGQATITWNAVAGVTYNLYMASVSGVTKSNYSSLTDGMQHVGVTSPYAHTGLTNGKPYYFVVTAVDANGESNESNQVSVTPQAVPVVTSTLNDTGITASQCYQAGSDVLVACDSAGAIALNNAQDGMAGRDADAATNSNTDGKLGFSFSSVTGGCVQDNVTGLMWENKTNDGGLRDWTKTYTNYSATYNPFNLYGTTTDTSGFVVAVNATNLCGYNDWRLPTADELQSIVDYSWSAVNATWFPNSQQQNVFWSGSPYVGGSSFAWVVHFRNGYVNNSGSRYVANYVRLVRAVQSPPNYNVSADGQEVTDNQTKLIWRRCAEGAVFSGGTCTGIASTFSQEAALQQAAAQSSNTGVAWRLPNIKEISSIADKSLSNPAIDSTAFPATPSSWFWSASPNVSSISNYAGYAWYVDFSNGYVGHYYRYASASHYVRLVRDGPSQQTPSPVFGAF